jgi:hypothetical protein
VRHDAVVYWGIPERANLAARQHDFETWNG